MQCVLVFKRRLLEAEELKESCTKNGRGMVDEYACCIVQGSRKRLGLP